MEGPRGATEEEFEQVLIMLGDNPSDSSLCRRFPLSFNRDNVENHRIMIEDGKIVSHQGISEREISVYGCKVKVGSIGGVRTLPEYQNRGFATKLLDDCIRKINEDGGDIMLVSGDRGLYRRAGCRRAGEVCFFKIKKQEVAKFDKEVEVVPYREENLTSVIAAYEKDPVRFYRTLSDFSVIAKNPYRGVMLTLHKGNKLVGYVVISSKEAVGSVIEYAGVRKAILDSISSLFAKYDLQELNLFVPLHDAELIYLLDEKEIEFTCSHSPLGTVKIVNFPRLMEKLHPYLEGRLNKNEMGLLQFEQKNGSPRGEDEFTIRFGKEELVIKEIEHLVFGTSEKEKPEIKGERLSNIIGRSFPIPLVWPGLNYV